MGIKSLGNYGKHQLGGTNLCRTFTLHPKLCRVTALGGELQCGISRLIGLMRGEEIWNSTCNFHFISVSFMTQKQIQDVFIRRVGLKLCRFQMQMKGTDFSPWVSRAREGFGVAAGNICALIKSTQDFVDGWIGLK